MHLLLPDSGLLFWMLLSFLVVLVILAKYGFPIITKMVESRKSYIDQSIKVARDANAQLAKLKEEGNALVVAANKEQGRILREAAKQRDQIIAEARKKAEIAVHVAEDAGLDSNDDKHQFTKDLLIQSLHAMGITNFTSQELDGLIKVAVQAMHLAWASEDTEPDTNDEVKANVPAGDVVKSQPVVEPTEPAQAGDKNA